MKKSNSYKSHTRRVATTTITTGLVTSAVALSSKWSKPLVQAVILPAHAQTSACLAGFTVEPVSEAIVIQVSASEVVGAVTVPRNGNSFSGSQEISLGSCADGSPKRQVAFLSGNIDVSSNSVEGELTIELYCGETLVCSEEATYIAPQQTSIGGADGEEGLYEGRLIGTITCCQDLVEGQI